MEKFGTIDSSEKTVAILGDTCRWWPQTVMEDMEDIEEKY